MRPDPGSANPELDSFEFCKVEEIIGVGHAMVDQREVLG